MPQFTVEEAGFFYGRYYAKDDANGERSLIELSEPQAKYELLHGSILPYLPAVAPTAAPTALGAPEPAPAPAPVPQATNPTTQYSGPKRTRITQI